MGPTNRIQRRRSRRFHHLRVLHFKTLAIRAGQPPRLSFQCSLAALSYLHFQKNWKKKTDHQLVYLSLTRRHRRRRQQFDYPSFRFPLLPFLYPSERQKPKKKKKKLWFVFNSVFCLLLLSILGFLWVPKNNKRRGKKNPHKKEKKKKGKIFEGKKGLFSFCIWDGSGSSSGAERERRWGQCESIRDDVALRRGSGGERDGFAAVRSV